MFCCCVLCHKREFPNNTLFGVSIGKILVWKKMICGNYFLQKDENETCSTLQKLECWWVHSGLILTIVVVDRGLILTAYKKISSSLLPVRNYPYDLTPESTYLKLLNIEMQSYSNSKTHLGYLLKMMGVLKMLNFSALFVLNHQCTRLLKFKSLLI